MAKFYGEIGFGAPVEVSPGVYEDVIVERSYYGDVIRDALDYRQSEGVHENLRTGNSFSIVADAYAERRISAMRYLRWSGALWTIRQVEVVRPRLRIRIGGVYNGPTPGAPRDS